MGDTVLFSSLIVATMDLIEFMKSLELILKLNRLALQMLTILLQQVSKCKGNFSVNQFDMVTTSLDLENGGQSEGKILGHQHLQLPTIVTYVYVISYSSSST